MCNENYRALFAIFAIFIATFQQMSEELIRVGNEHLDPEGDDFGRSFHLGE